MQQLTTIATLALLAVGLSGCTGGGETIMQAGSSTVLPLASVWAEEFGQSNGVRIEVGGGGSGRGASGLCSGELNIGDMSRPIKSSEIETCQSNGVEPVEWKIAFDGLSVVVSNKNTFLSDLSVDQLNHLFRSADFASKWSDVDPTFPSEPVRLCYPDEDSGTYEYFNEEILGKGAHPRIGDGVEQSPDDNILVRCLQNDQYAIGYFGYAYVIENTDVIRPLSIDGVLPNPSTIADNSYTPLSRPIFMYTDGVPAAGTALHDYFAYVFGAGQNLVSDVGYVALDAGTKGDMLAQLGS